MTARDAAQLYVRWKGVSAVFHRGYWLVASLYLVLDANLSAFQLVSIGTAQGVISIVCEVPAGVIADMVSRKWSLVLAHVLMGSAMLVTGLVTAFPALVATQMLWGLAWTFVSGADVAWVSDELDQPERIGRVLAASARWEAVGAAVGLTAFGGLAWAADRGVAIVMSGAATVVMGAWVAGRFPETNFVRVPGGRIRASGSTLRRGYAIVRGDREVLLIAAAAFLANGAAEAFGRLYAKRLVELGLPSRPDPIVWYTALGLSVLLVGAIALRIVEARIDGVGVARRMYAAACAVGLLGSLVLAAAPNELAACFGVLLFSGVALTVTRAVGAIWVNRRATNDVRATVHSMVAQAEYLGEIVCGFGLALLARETTISSALVGAAALLALTSVLVLRSTSGRESSAATFRV